MKYLKIIFIILFCIFIVKISNAGITFSGCINGSEPFTAPAGTDYTSTADAAYYMNSSSTPEVDRSGNSADLAYTNTPASSATVPDGFNGNSLDFASGDSDGLTMSDGGSTDISGDTDFTVCIWVNPETLVASGTKNCLLGKNHEADNQRQFRLALDTSGIIKMEWHSAGTYSAGTASFFESDSAEISTGSWQHIAAVFDIGEPSSSLIYVDGETVAATAVSSNATTIYNGTADFTVGCDTGGTNNYFDGLIDEVMIYPGKLTQEQIQEIMVNGISGNNGGND